MNEHQFKSPQGQHGLKKFIIGFTFAYKGLKTALLTQINFKFHCIAAIVVIALGCFLNLNWAEWLWLSLAITIVLVTELINTAIEFIVDLISPNYNPIAGKIKDLGSGAVLVAAIFAAIVGVVILLPKIW